MPNHEARIIQYLSATKQLHAKAECTCGWEGRPHRCDTWRAETIQAEAMHHLDATKHLKQRS